MNGLVLVRLVLLGLSYWGYYRALCVWTRMERTFMPLFVLSVQAVMIFLAGLAGLMLPAAYALYYGGIAALALSFAPCLSGGKKADYPAGIWLLMGLTAYAVFLLYGKRLTYNDDFSHWGLVVRIMLEGNTLAFGADALVQFSSYPPGTACLLYYVCRMVTGAAACEWAMLTVQAVLVMSCAAPLAALVKKPMWCGLAAALMAAWFAAGTGIRLYELMVDNVMPMIAIGCMALIALRGQEPGGRGWEAALLPPLALLTLTKNSAFVFVIFVYLAYAALRRPHGLAAWLRTLPLLLPLCMLLLWRAYAAKVEPGMLKSMHAMSQEYFTRILADKSMLDVLDTIHLMKEKTLQELYVAFLGAAGLAVAGVMKMARIRLDAHARLLPWLNLLFYGVYQFGLLCMYIMSMHVVEASLLLQYERYENSIRLLMTGVLLIYALCAASAIRAQRPKAAAAACAGVLALCVGCAAVGKPDVQALWPQDQSDSLRARMENLLEGYPRGEENRYLLAISSPDFRADAHYCARYLLDTPHVRTANVYEGIYDEAWYETIWREYDYLIILDPYPAVETFVQAHFPEQAQQRVIALR